MPLDILALGSLESIEIERIEANKSYEIADCTVTTRPLHHYSGLGDNRRYLDTLGYRLETKDGPTVRGSKILCLTCS